MVVVEVSGTGKATVHHRVTASRLTIGRSLTNDIVVDDPYIEGDHLLLTFDSEENTWFVHDLGSTNGTSVSTALTGGSGSTDNTGTQPAANALRLVGPDPLRVSLPTEITIGKTRVRLLDRNHPVAPAKSLRDLEHWLLSLGSNRWLIPSLGVVFAIAAASNYLETWEEIKPTATFNALALMSSILLISTGIWSLLARVLRGETRFAPLLTLSCLESIAFSVTGLVFGFLAYNTPGLEWRDGIKFAAESALTCAFLYAGLRIATNLTSVARAGFCILGFVSALTFYSVNLSSNQDTHYANPQYDGRLLPPPLAVVPPESPAEFSAELPSIFDAAIELAKDEEDDDGSASDRGADKTDAEDLLGEPSLEPRD